jgi:Zn-dependent peptidase ImmA (M78 family)/DNA-binding XRE family transcriptional regulator
MTTNLQEIRKRAGLRQSQLAERLNLDASLVSRWESGDREPTVAQYQELARLLGVTVDYLINGRLETDVFKFRAGKTLTPDETQATKRALTDAEQQVHFLAAAWEMTGKLPKPFPLTVSLGGGQWESAAEDIRNLLRLNERVTYAELKQALTERGVHVFSWHLPVKLSGLSYRGTFTMIVVNDDHPETRRLFTLAHEAIHALCHLSADVRAGDGVQRAAVSIASNRDPQEKEANGMAAELLMPTRAIEEIVREYGARLKSPQTLDVIAQSFNVSREAMFYRLTDPKFGVFTWAERAKYFTSGDALERAAAARVSDIPRQVAPEFLRIALKLYAAEEVSAGKLAEWFACSQQTLEKYLSRSERAEAETGLFAAVQE